MRRIIPEKIKQLSDKIAPYMEYDEKRNGYFLKDDAPKEVVNAQKEFHDWMSKQERGEKTNGKR